MAYQSGIKKEVVQLLFLFLATLIIYYPVLYAEYAYTDELVGLWQWNNGNADSTNTLLLYGRYITARLAALLFGSAETISDLKYIRIFSLSGWILCLPAWYYVFKRITQKENLPDILPFFVALYLVCTPSFAISIGWAACFEMFIANTAGLLSGYFLYTILTSRNKNTQVHILFLFLSLVSGLIALFTYQVCFGCFLLPFLIHFIGNKKASKNLLLAIAFYFLIYVIYYALFRYSLYVNHISPGDRTRLHINIGKKLSYFLARPLASSFHFTYLFNEKSIAGLIVYIVIAGLWFLFAFFQMQSRNLSDKLKYFILLFCLLGLVFLPSLVVRENYASNRTLFSLRIAVFLLASTTLLSYINTASKRTMTVGVISILFCANAWYNFNKQFLLPVKREYETVRSFIEKNYSDTTRSLQFVRPGEDFFTKRYVITRSWDEFAVPSTFFDWTPPYLAKQVVFEKTGNRKEADELKVDSWLSNNVGHKKDSLHGGLLINVENLLSVK